MAAPNLSELVATTTLNRRKQISDQVSNNNALLTRLKSRGKMKTFSGGREIAEALAYQENPTYKRYSGYDILDIRPSEVLSAAVYGIKQAAVAITMSGLERLQNAGKQRIIELLDARMEVAEDTFANKLSEDVYSDGMADNGRQINGLNALVSSSPTTGTAGGISRASWQFWRHQYATIASLGANDGKDLEKAMRSMWVKLCRGSEKPDLGVFDNETYTTFWGALAERQRFSGQGDMARAGFSSLKFNTMDVVLDGGIGGNCPARTAFFLNTKYIKWRPHSDRNMVPMDARRSFNQDATVSLILWAGNLTMNGAMHQGRLYGTAA